EHDEWFADLPVVLRTEEAQLEVCAKKLDDLSVTWSTIDLAVTPTAWVEWTLKWRRDAHPALRRAAGQVIRQVSVMEHSFTTQRVHPPAEPGEGRSSGWLLGGLVLELDQGCLQIYNALDENGLSSEPPRRSPDFRMTVV
ncbi:hypothetical protein HC030_28525, partial [Planosporangium mesophilum]